MSYLTQLKAYIQNNGETFAFSYMTQDQGLSYQKDLGKAAYRFNWGEKVGWVLLYPQKLIYDAWDDTDNCFIKFVLILASLAVLAFTLLGLFFRKLGEETHSQPEIRDRQEGIKLLREIGDREQSPPVAQFLNILATLNEMANPQKFDLKDSVSQNKWRALWSQVKDILKGEVESADQKVSSLSECLQALTTMLETTKDQSQVKDFFNNFLYPVLKDRMLQSKRKELKELYQKYEIYALLHTKIAGYYR